MYEHKWTTKKVRCVFGTHIHLFEEEKFSCPYFFGLVYMGLGGGEAKFLLKCHSLVLEIPTPEGEGIKDDAARIVNAARNRPYLTVLPVR